MIQTLLTSQKASFRIAQVALLFQGGITFLVASELLTNKRADFIAFLVTLDVAFICIHLLYRATYKGPKIRSSISTKQLASVHSILACITLLVTLITLRYGLIHNDLTQQLLSIGWITTFAIGLLFFVKKYIVLEVAE